MQRKMVFVATQCGSFAEAERTLAELASLSVRAKRIWLATQRAGHRQLVQQQQAVRDYEALPLPARRQSPANVVTPRPSLVLVEERAQFRRHADGFTPEIVGRSIIDRVG